MRWERLFSDVEAEVEEIEREERDALAQELGDEEWAATSWAEVLGGEVELEIDALGRVRGRLERRTAGLLGLSSGPRDLLVPHHAVRQVVSTQERSGAPSRLAGRTRWTAVLRRLRDEAEPVEVVDRSGSVTTGVVEVVGQDFVALDTPSGRRIVPWNAVAVVRTER